MQMVCMMQRQRRAPEDIQPDLHTIHAAHMDVSARRRACDQSVTGD